MCLLEALVEFGFGGILIHGKGFGENSDELSLRELGVTKCSIQQRANSLIRELHALESAEVIIRRIEERRNRMTPTTKDISSTDITTTTKKTMQQRQTGLRMFLKKSSKPSVKDQKGSVVVLDGNDDIGNELLRKKRRNEISCIGTFTADPTSDDEAVALNSSVPNAAEFYDIVMEEKEDGKVEVQDTNINALIQINMDGKRTGEASYLDKFTESPEKRMRIS